MEMKVDSHLIKEERKKRAWSQEHLARVSGLGHRTIQRIENTGFAAYESVMAIAAALDLDTSALRIKDDDVLPGDETSDERQLPVRLELPARLLLALISGILVPLILDGPFAQNFWTDTPDYFGRDFIAALIRPFCGALFGLTVLCPYLKRDNKLLLNSLILTVSGAASFMCAYWASFFLLDINELFAFVAASFIGAAIVIIASKRVMPIKPGITTWLCLMLAAVVGGVAVYGGLVRASDYEFGTFAAVLAFCTWHCVLTVLLYYGRSSDESGNHPCSILLDFLAQITGKSKLPGYYFDADKSERWDGSFAFSRSEAL
jgi:transcriptional regulator with XRE-family HTH domain